MTDILTNTDDSPPPTLSTLPASGVLIKDALAAFGAALPDLGASPSTAAVYGSALRSLLRDYEDKPLAWMQAESHIRAAVDEFKALYSTSRFGQAVAAWERFREYARANYDLDLPRGRKHRARWRKAGATYKSIGERLGCSATTAKRWSLA